MKEFAMFKMKKDFYDRLGLPHTPFPVPVEEIESITMTGNIEYPQLLYWLQEYSALNPNEWHSFESTMSRLAELIALDDGRLKVSVYLPLDAKACSYLVHLGTKPHPEHGINMRENNWEYALDNSATMGNMYASKRGESYLSYWQYGIGLDSKKDPVSVWFEMRDLKPVPPNISATQIGLWYVNSAENV